VALLHGKGVDVNRKMLLLGAFATSPLAVAVNFGEVDVIKALVAAGADIKEHDDDGLSLLHMAVLTNHLEAAQALVAAGVPLNDVDKHGYTPLLYASTVDFGDDRMVKLLLRAGADSKVRAKAGETALSQARRYQYPHIQTALENAGARD
jgi:ankyrin repeat protein